MNNKWRINIKKSWFPVMVVLVLVGVFGVRPAGGEAQVRQEEVRLYGQDFEGQLGEEWKLDEGWEVAVVDGGHALKGEGHTWATLTLGGWTDYRVRFRLKVEADSGVHANMRLVQPVRYFIGLTQDYSYLSKQTGGNDFQEGLANGSGLGAGWHQMEIRAYGGEISATVDGKALLQYSDPQPLSGGRTAFEVLDGRVWIDDVEVWGPQTEVVPTASAELHWIRTGGPLGGLGYDIRMRPDNPDRMYVTDAKAGVFMSTDGGMTWFPSNAGITTRTGGTGEEIPVFCLTIDPNNADILWAGTQFQRGIFKSTDGGTSWVKMDNGVVEKDGITFRGFGVQPGNSDIVYAAGEVSSWTWNSQPLNGHEFDKVKGVVYKSTDGGQSWKVVWRGNNLARYIWIDPRNTNVVYVSTGIFDREAADADWEKGIAGGEGVIKSTDGGQSWSNVNKGLKNLYVGSLFMHPTNPDILVAGTENITFPKGNGVYLSSDGGANWEEMSLPEGMDHGIEAVEISTSNPQIIYAGGASTIFRSNDGGDTWERVSGGQQSPWGPPDVMAGFPIDFQVDPRNAERIFTNNYGGGNFLSVDGGRSWTSASQGYTGAQTWDIRVDPAAAGHVLVTARSGLFESWDGGATWNGLNSGEMQVMEWHPVALEPGNPEHILGGTNFNGIGETHDGGRTWDLVYPLVRSGGEAYCNNAPNVLEFASSDAKTVYLGTAAFTTGGSFNLGLPASGIFKSTDGGSTWGEANDALSGDAVVFDLAVEQENKDGVYAATVNHGMLKTTDGGKNWREINQGLGKSSMMAIAIHPQGVLRDPVQAQTLFGGSIISGMFRSTDGGENWSRVSRGIPPEASITSIVFDPTDAEVMYCADIASGVYRSIDGGESWAQMNQGLSNRSIMRLALSADGQHLYAGSLGAGVFRMDLNGQPPAAGIQPGSEFIQPSVPAATNAATLPVIADSGTAQGAGQEIKLVVVGGLLLLAGVGLIWVVSMVRKR